MPIDFLQDIVHPALRWLGVEGEGDPRSDLAKALSKNDDFASIYEAAERGQTAMIPDSGFAPWHPIFNPRPSVSSGDEGGGGGGPYRTPARVPVPESPIVAPVSAPSPATDLPSDLRLSFRDIDWAVLRDRNHDAYIRHFTGGLSYRRLRAALDFFHSDPVVSEENPAELILVELTHNIHRCINPARQLGDPLFRLETMTEGEFQSAARLLQRTRVRGFDDYRRRILRLDRLYDSLAALDRHASPDAVASVEAQIREQCHQIRLARDDVRGAVWNRGGIHEILSMPRMIREGDGQPPPRLSEIRRSVVEDQIRRLLPESMRSERYHRLVSVAASVVLSDLRAMTRRDLERLYREETAFRGACLSAAAPESLVLGVLEGLERTSGYIEPADAPVFAQRLRERRGSTDDGITRELAEPLRRAGRLVER